MNAPVTDTEITIGNTNPTVAPPSYSVTARRSVLAELVNDNGGINGRKIKWIPMTTVIRRRKPKNNFGN